MHVCTQALPQDPTPKLKSCHCQIAQPYIKKLDSQKKLVVFHSPPALKQGTKDTHTQLKKAQFKRKNHKWNNCPKCLTEPVEMKTKTPNSRLLMKMK